MIQVSITTEKISTWGQSANQKKYRLLKNHILSKRKEPKAFMTMKIILEKIEKQLMNYNVSLTRDTLWRIIGLHVLLKPSRFLVFEASTQHKNES